MTEERLKKYLAIKRELKGIERRLEELEAEVYGVKARQLEYTRADTRSKADFSRKLDKLIDLRSVYEKKWDELIDERAAIEGVIEELPPLYRAMMRAKYIDGMTWEEVAAEVGYSHRQIMRIVGEWRDNNYVIVSQAHL